MTKLYNNRCDDKYLISICITNMLVEFTINHRLLLYCFLNKILQQIYYVSITYY